MSELARREPRHWHNTTGTHRMPDPRKFESYPRKFWDEDERHYVEHLEEHERLAKIPQPREDDPDDVTALFELIAAAENSIAASRELINAKRMLMAKARRAEETSR